MKIKWGALIVDGRGKLGGHVAAKNRSGAYLRTKVTPTNPQTTFQTGVRNLFASLSQAWSGLTQTVRDGWNSAVSNWSQTDIFGDIKLPTGKNLYLRLNSLAQQAGWPGIATAPAKAEMPVDDITGVNLNLASSTVELTGNTTDATVRYMFFATPPLTQGTLFVKNRLRLIDAQLASTIDPSNLFSAYENKFGSITIGNNIVFGFKKVLANGQPSPQQIIKVTITG